MKRKIKKNATSKLVITAKVSADLKAALQKSAEDEERTISQMIGRLLASHPALQPYMSTISK